MQATGADRRIDKYWKSMKRALRDAVKEGRLSDDERKDDWVGRYQYLGPDLRDKKKRDMFRHVFSRESLG